MAIMIIRVGTAPMTIPRDVARLLKKEDISLAIRQLHKMEEPQKSPYSLTSKD